MAFLYDFHFWHVMATLGLLALNFAHMRQVSELIEILLDDDDEEPENGN